MLRRKDLPDYFMYRGNRLAFHRLADGPSLGRLDPYAPGEQAWPMLNGHEIAVTAEEIRDITYQVYGITLPPVDPRDVSGLEQRIAALEAKLAEQPSAPAAVASEPETTEAQDDAAPDPRDEALAAALAEAERLRAEVEALKSAVPAPTVPDMGERLADWGDVAAEQQLTQDDLLDLMRGDVEGAQDVIGKLTRDSRRRFTELLNVELAELQQVHGAAGENLKREADIEQLLGLFARVGEM